MFCLVDNSATFQRINRKSTNFWKCQMYDLVTSYESKPLLATPFSIFNNMYQIVRYTVNRLLGKNILYNRKLSKYSSFSKIN